MCDSTHCSANDRVGTVRSACPRGARSASLHGFGGPRPDGGPESRSSQPRRTAEANSCTPAVLEPKRGEIACGRRRAGMANLAKWAADEHADIKLSTSSSCISVTAVEPCRSSSATVPGTADSAPAGTDFITALAVDARGQSTNGYREAPAGSISELAGCDQPSPASVSTGFYSCYPSAAAADVCWPSPPTSMLCMNNPWGKEVRRLGLDTCLLPTVQPPATPEPFALTLDNGTHCRLITGGTRRARSDGYVPFYACRADSTPSVLGEAGSETDRSTAQDPCGW